MRACGTRGGMRPARYNGKEVHISGAEGLYEASDIQKAVKQYVERALSHPRGKVDRILLTIEDIMQDPREISSLPLATVKSRTPSEGETIAKLLLGSLCVSEKAMKNAFSLIRKGGMTGAAVVTELRGVRLDRNRQRGIRVSRLGLSRPALKSLSSRLSRLGINTDTVREALTLASKVLSSRRIVAELCISDDPDYTTGYIASREFGYVRIPNIKSRRSREGGRTFFVREGTHIKEIGNYLERVPVVIREIAPCRGMVTIDEILDSPDQ